MSSSFVIMRSARHRVRAS